MTDGLHGFRAHMAEVMRQVHSAPAPAKAQRYVQMHEAGLPLDVTVRWYPATAVGAMESRVEELTGQGREVWISQGLPWDPGVADALASVEKKTDLIKDLNSVADFRGKALPRLKDWKDGSWAKLYYDTPVRSLTGGTIGFDTNRYDSITRFDSRTVRLEAASGISDVRDLQRQMSARNVVVGYSDSTLFSAIEAALEPMDYSLRGVGPSDLVGSVRDMGPSEPRVVTIDCANSPSEGLTLLEQLKGSDVTARVPVVLIVDAEDQYPAELRARVAGIISHPLSPEEVRASISRTGFRLLGDAFGFTLTFPGTIMRREVEHLLNTVTGFGGTYRRMMARIANLEARPTIAFEFKFVPLAPYEFFFIDYEWSGVKHELHRFDWLFCFRDT